MYVMPNFRTIKALKDAVSDGKYVKVVSAGYKEAERNGTEDVEGPHYPDTSRWRGKVEVKRGRVVKVIN